MSRSIPMRAPSAARLPDEEKLAEAFAAWFLMPLPAVASAMRRMGISRPRGPEDVHQIACWLGTSFAGTARHLVNLQLADTHEGGAMGPRLAQRQRQDPRGPVRVPHAAAGTRLGYAARGERARGCMSCRGTPLSVPAADSPTRCRPAWPSAPTSS